jgi:pyrimidine operon attenuation protein/uracil phosphoribosyltransferase
VVIDETGVRSVKPFGAAPRRFCIFEYIYFARPDSVVEGTGVYQSRKRIGAELARESHVDADVVVPVPDSGVPAAMGYASEARIPYELGIIRNHYVGRTFIEPTDQIRHLGVKLKHSANRAMLEGKRVILVDDSIVRGTTSKKIVEMVRQAGRRRCTCASPRRRRRIPASTASTRRPRPPAGGAERRGADGALIGVDSLAFISLDGLYRALGKPGRNAANPGFCDACFTGDYAIPLTDWPSNEDQRAASAAERLTLPTKPLRSFARDPGHHPTKPLRGFAVTAVWRYVLAGCARWRGEVSPPSRGSPSPAGPEHLFCREASHARPPERHQRLARRRALRAAARLRRANAALPRRSGAPPGFPRNLRSRFRGR